MTSSFKIQNIPECDRPRERLFRFGPDSLSSAELIAIILGSGTRGISVLELAQQIVTQFGDLNKLADTTIEEFCQIKGLGKAKAIQLRAALSLGSRLKRQAGLEKERLQTPEQAYYLVRDELEGKKQEIFLVLMKDVKGNLIKRETISVGTLSNTLVHPREVFYPAIRHKASSIILSHNHPSGDPTPSKDDLTLTKKLIESGRLMGIPVHDHLIIGLGCYVSLRESGQIVFH